MSETWDLRPDGLRFWELVKEGPLLVRSNQNGYRLVRDGLIGLGVLVAIPVLTQNLLVMIAAWLILLAAFSASVWWYWTRERPLGQLLALISEEAIQIGCERDDICIPWVAVDTEATYLPVNNSFMAIPVLRTQLETIVLFADEKSTPWDRQPYRRGILTMKYNSDMSWIEVYANPNGFFVNVLTVVYPMIGIWRERQTAAEGPSPGDER